MKKFFYIFLSRPVTAGMFFFSIVILGLVSVFNLPVELSPQVEFPKLTVRVNWHGVSSEAVEANVTSVIESELAILNGVKKITSSSSEGSSRIDVEFHPKTDMDFARIEINEKLSALKDELPYGISPPRISQYIPSDLRDLQGFMTYSISGNESASKIRKYVKEKMLYSITAINGVSDVDVIGGTEREISIIIDYEKAKALGIRNDEITSAIRNSEQIISAGVVKKGNGQHFIKIQNTIANADVINWQPVKTTSDGNVIRVSDIGRVIDDYRDPTRYYRINGKETITLRIDKELGANTIEIAEKVKSRIKQLEGEMPKGFIIKKETDKSEAIEKELNELFSSAVYSFFIIIIVLLFIYRRVKHTFVIITSIIFSLLFSFLLFYLFELPLNILTIASFILGFGFMVDNSIVVVDYIDRHYGNDGIKYLTVILKNIFHPVFASTLTTIAVFVPLLFLTGELRLYFEQFALGIVFTLLASLIVAFTIIPLLYIKFGKRKAQAANAEKKGLLFKVYNFILSRMINHKKISLAVVILLIGLPVWLIPNRIDTPVIGEVYNSVFDSDFYAEAKPYTDYIFGGSLNLFFNHISRGEVWKYGNETYIYVRLELPNGNRIERLNNLCKKFESEILSYEGNFKYITSNVYNEEVAVIKILFTPEQSLAAFPYSLKNYLAAYASRLGGLTTSVSGFGPGFYNGGGGSMASFSVTVKGFNYKKVKEIAVQFRDLIKRNPRIDNVDIDKSNSYRSKDTYEIFADVNREALASRNISIEELFGVIRRNTRGNLGYNYFKIGNDEVQYSIKFTNYHNMQLNELDNLIVYNGEGENLKVKDLVKFREQKVQSAINREDQQYVRYVSFRYKGPYKYGKKFTETSMDKVIMPEGYSIDKKKFWFSFEDDDEIEVWKILLMSVILIFMITASLFESLKKPSIILISIPFAIIGTIFLFHFGEYNLDRGAYAGILLLVGLSVNNSIILIDHLSKNTIICTIENVINLSYSRLRPIFTTTITTITALIPLLIGAESSFWKSLSLSITGGIFFSALIIILYVPLVFYLMEKK